MGYPWYAFYPAKYRKRTAALSMAQDGAYRRLMDHYYETGEPLPAIADQLLRICRAFDEAEKAAVLYVLELYFVEGDDGWHHLTIDEEIVKRAGLSQKRAEAGSKGADRTNGKRAATVPATPSAKVRQLPTHLQLQSQDSSSLRSELSAQARPVDPIPGKSLIPDWIPVEAWKGYVEMRNGIRAPLKARAISLTIGKLDELRRSGEDIGAVLDQSTQNSWRGVFPVKQTGGTNGSGHGEKRTATDQHLSGIGSLISDIRAGRA